MRISQSYFPPKSSILRARQRIISDKLAQLYLLDHHYYVGATTAQYKKYTVACAGVTIGPFQTFVAYRTFWGPSDLPQIHVQVQVQVQVLKSVAWTRDSEQEQRKNMPLLLRARGDAIR